jgi:hypothetical protein
MDISRTINAPKPWFLISVITAYESTSIYLPFL